MENFAVKTKQNVLFLYLEISLEDAFFVLRLYQLPVII